MQESNFLILKFFYSQNLITILFKIIMFFHSLITVNPINQISNIAYKNLVGAILIKLATGLFATYGNTNLYFLSYLLNQGHQINNNTFSFIMLLSLVPMGLIILISVKLSYRFGFQLVIKICGFVYLISPLLFSIRPNVYTFSILCMLLPASAFSISSIPLINIIWTYFPDHKHKITSLLVFFFTLSGIIWNYIFMRFINPDNISASIEHLGRNYFDTKVTDNLISIYNTIVTITGILFILGSFLIKQKKKVQKQDIQLKQIVSHELQQITNTQTVQKTYSTTKSLCSLILSKNFLCLYMSTLLISLYFTYFFTYNKLIFIQLINDDHFLTYCTIVYSIMGLLGTFVWGYIGDLKGIKITIFIYTIVDIGFKLMIFFTNSKLSLFLYYLGLGFCSKGMITIGGPGLVQLFGLKKGTELLPVKGTSMMITFAIIPIAQILTAKLMNPINLLKFLGILSIFSIIPSILLKSPSNITTISKD